MLGEFESNPVVRSSIAVTKAGDGLSDALSAGPRTFHEGEMVYVVLRTKVSKITFEAEKEKDRESDDDMVRKHTLSTEVATIVEPKLVKELLDKQAEQIARAAAAKKNQTTIDTTDTIHVDGTVTPIKAKRTAAKASGAKKAPAKRAPRKRASKPKTH